ncbi:unnamed protein product [Larinioides sclopetarius]|uniref:Uncharacterized protein n=1 Tax=Larinioides sclopetarius TaxID=280406 RepID=A0AAV2AT25_9ARAC
MQPWEKTEGYFDRWNFQPTKSVGSKKIRGGGKDKSWREEKKNVLTLYLKNFKIKIIFIHNTKEKQYQ